MSNSWFLDPVSPEELERRLLESKARLARAKVAEKERKERWKVADPQGVIPVYSEDDRGRLKVPPFQKALDQIDRWELADEDDSGELATHDVEVPKDLQRELDRAMKTRPGGVGFINFRDAEMASLAALPKSLGVNPASARIAQGCRPGVLRVFRDRLTIELPDGSEDLAVSSVKTIRVEGSGRFLYMFDGGRDPYCVRAVDGLSLGLSMLIVRRARANDLARLRREIETRILS